MKKYAKWYQIGMSDAMNHKPINKISNPNMYALYLRGYIQGEENLGAIQKMERLLFKQGTNQ